MTKKFMPPDLRPSRADPEARQDRKKLEKEIHMFGWKEVAVLSVIGLTGLLLNTERDLKKAEERHDRRHDRYARDHHSATADDSDSDSDDGQRRRRSRRGSASDAEADRAKKRTAATTTGNMVDRQRSRRGSAGDAEGRMPADGSRGRRRSMHHQNRLRYYDRRCDSHSRGGHKHRRRDGSDDEEAQRERRDGRDWSWGPEVEGEERRRKHSR